MKRRVSGRGALISKVTQEYDVTMFTAKGARVDREPDTCEMSVEAGQVGKNVCVSTELDPRWSPSNLGRRVEIRLRSDTPFGFAIINDMVTVDVKSVAVPKR